MLQSSLGVLQSSFRLEPLLIDFLTECCEALAEILVRCCHTESATRPKNILGRCQKQLKQATLGGIPSISVLLGVLKLAVPFPAPQILNSRSDFQQPSTPEKRMDGASSRRRLRHILVFAVTATRLDRMAYSSLSRFGHAPTGLPAAFR